VPYREVAAADARSVRPSLEVHLKPITHCLLVSILLAFVPANGDAQTPYKPQESRSAPDTVAWIGCWVLHATEDAEITRLDSVRLLSAPIPADDGRTHYWGRRLHEKPGYFTKAVTWSLGQANETVEIRVEALGGTVWRVKQDGDSLVGYAYATYDVIRGEDLFGRATGRRVKC
jgi:hypothetical protein